MRILVVGCGSIGRRHIRLLREMGAEVCAYDIDERAAHDVQEEFGIPATFGGNMTEHLNKGFGGVIIATPTHLHYDCAMKALAVTDAVVLVEKPITASLDEAAGLVEWFADAEQPLLVGYCLRWHPGLQRVKAMLDSGVIGRLLHARIFCGSYLPEWRPNTDYRQGYAARRDTGGGVLLDVSHEIDVANWLCGEPTAVTAMVANSGALEIETEDVADLLIRYQGGAQASVSLSYLTRFYDRGLVITGDAGSINYRFNPQGYEIAIHPNGEQITTQMPVDEMYRAELRHFLAVCRGEEQPLVTGADGLRAVRIVEAAKESSATGRVVIL